MDGRNAQTYRILEIFWPNPYFRDENEPIIPKLNIIHYYTYYIHIYRFVGLLNEYFTRNH